MTPLTTAYDPEHFRREGHQLVDFLADWLAASQQGKGAVLPPMDPQAELAYWDQRLANPEPNVSQFLADFVHRSINLQHPHYIGHQVCAPAPAAALAGLVAELLNNGMAVYEMGPAASALERWVIHRTIEAIGFSTGDGILTSGGTLATLTALLTARAVKLGDAALQSGTHNEWAVLASEEAHFCTSRALQVMGLGREGLITIPTDDRFKMRVDLLAAGLEEARQRGKKVFAVVASACSTSTGSYDDLAAIADFCQQHELWMHVDGAHGAAVAFCPALKYKIAGIERADSVVLDFHKLLMMPALATAVLYRAKSTSWAAFHQYAQYLFPENEPDPWRDTGRRTFECTKLSMSVKIATVWSGYGPGLAEAYLTKVHQLASDFALLIGSRAGFELAVNPESNIVCFRLRPPGLDEEAVTALNARARQEMIASGDFYLVQTKLRGQLWLRVSLMHPQTTLAMLEELLSKLSLCPA